MMNPETRPLIGVTSSDRGSWMGWTFNRLAVWRAGGRPMRISPRRPRGAAGLDGLVIGGGDDIGAELYGGEVALNVRIDPGRDALERQLFEEARTRDLPVLGICRGAQMINVVFGGSLLQDYLRVYEEAPRGRILLPRRAVFISPDSELRKLIGRERIRVNSLHKQAVDRLGRGLSAVARDRHGMIQGIERSGGAFLIGVQWHPEFLPWDRRQMRLYRRLCAAAAERRAAG